MWTLCNHKKGIWPANPALALKYTLIILTTSKECKAISLGWTSLRQRQEHNVFIQVESWHHLRQRLDNSWSPDHHGNWKNSLGDWVIESYWWSSSYKCVLICAVSLISHPVYFLCVTNPSPAGKQSRHFLGRKNQPLHLWLAQGAVPLNFVLDRRVNVLCEGGEKKMFWTSMSRYDKCLWIRGGVAYVWRTLHSPEWKC